MTSPKTKTLITTAAIMLTVIVFLFSSAGITAVAAARSLPGDSLYGLKTGVERTRLNITSQEAQRVSLNLRYARLRLDEIERLIAKGRFDDLPEAIQVYERYVQNAINSLDVVAKNDPQAALQLNTELSALLREFAQALSAYAAALPASAKTPLTGAIDFSKSAGAYKGELEFIGTLESMESGYWIISGHKIIITPATEIEGLFNLGDSVEVEAWVDMNGNIYGEEIEHDDGNYQFKYMDDDDDMEFLGMVDEIGPGYWIINGQRFELTGNTEIEGNIQVGDLVEVEAMMDKSGRMLLVEVEFAFDDDMDDQDDDMDDDMYDDDDDMYDDDDDDMYDDDDDMNDDDDDDMNDDDGDDMYDDDDNDDDDDDDDDDDTDDDDDDDDDD